jgi:predicted nucleic acid-binding protein
VFPSTFRVVIDACALYPMNMRDTLLRAASEGYFQLYWSDEILDEMSRNLVENDMMSEAKATGLRQTMEEAFPDAMVIGYEGLVASMQNDEKDRHVTAAAVKAGAQVIVTSNLRDFKKLPDGIEAQSPDDFLCHLFDLQPSAMMELLIEQARDRRRPPVTFENMLASMEKTLPSLVKFVREHVRTCV